MLVIMFSQLLNAVKEHLPYKKRLLSLAALTIELNSLALVMESEWFKVGKGLLTEEEINNLHMDIKRKKLQSTAKCFPDLSLPLDKRLLAQAEADTKLYVQTYFNGG